MNVKSFYWGMPSTSGTSSTAGFSWYTRIFSLFQEGKPLPMQMGMGGTWLTATNIHFNSQQGQCACNPKGWPSTTKGDGRYGCCNKGGSMCADLYETFEGGPGYWMGMIPTQMPRWRINSAVGCYSDQTSTPLFDFGGQRAHACSSMGLAQVSNQLVLPPDGLTFSKQGLLGVAYVRTPIGKTTASDNRNFWTVLFDTKDFSGPLAYFLPEFFKARAKNTHMDKDFGTPGVGLSFAPGAFEWNTIFGYKASNGVYKIPKITLPRSPMRFNATVNATSTSVDAQRTVLLMNPRGFENADIFDPLETALQTGSLDTTKLMSGGKRLNCKGGTRDAEYHVEGSRSVKVATLETTVEDGDCVWSAHTEDSSGKLPQYFSSNLKPISEANAPPELRAQSFPAKGAWGPYDAISHPPSGSCMKSPADPDLYCIQTQSPSWVAFKWYKFVEQPAFQRVGLSAQEKQFLQGRVEKLHRMTGRTSRWIKARHAEGDLAVVDPVQFVTPPKGLEVGYVPIAVYEGLEKPKGCSKEETEETPTEFV